MHPILLNTGFFTVYSYGVMLAVAFLAGILVAMYFAEREGIDPEVVLDIALWTIISAIAGARVLYVILFLHEFSGNLLEIFMIQHGGLVFYGGLIASLIAIHFRARAVNLSLWKAFDIASPAALLGYSIARVGCFLNGCCYGVPASVPWAVVFPDLSGHRHPTQLYASLTVFMIFIIIVLLWRKKRFEGQIFLESVMMYSVYRFAIEFLRTNERYYYLSASQWLSIIAASAALGVFIWKRRIK